MYLQISRKKVELFQNQRDQIVQLYMSVKSSDMMSNSNNHLYKTTISSKNATPKKQRLLGDFPQQTPRVFSTTLASPAAARASASAAFKTAGWAASLGVEVAVFYLIIYISFQKKCQVVGHGEFWTNCMSIQYVSVSKVRKKTMSLHMFFIESLPQKHSCHYHPFLVFQWNICIHLIHLFFSCRKFMTTHTVEELKGFHCFQAV